MTLGVVTTRMRIPLSRYLILVDYFSSPQADDMSKILDQYTLDTSTNEALVSYSTETLLEQMRMTYAMVISLFAVSTFFCYVFWRYI